MAKVLFWDSGNMTDYLINSPNTVDYPSKKINWDIYLTLNAKKKKVNGQVI